MIVPYHYNATLTKKKFLVEKELKKHIIYNIQKK